MTRDQATQAVRAAREDRGLTWRRLAEVVGRSPEWTTIKELIHEEFGDGIMSAIDFEMTIARRADPKGDRVVVTLDGKFLPYRTW